MMRTSESQGFSSVEDSSRLVVSPFRRLLCFSFPAVQAADNVDQPNMFCLVKEHRESKPCDSGWDRVRNVFLRDENEMYSQELRSIIKSAITAAMVGLVYGGLPGARNARERFIQLRQADIYQSRIEAVRSAHNAAVRGFVRFGWRWSWRVATFVTLFNVVRTGLTVYRDKNTMSNFMVAGAVTGGMFRLNLGLRGVLAGTVIGASLGLPAGCIIIGLQSLGADT